MIELEAAATVQLPEEVSDVESGTTSEEKDGDDPHTPTEQPEPEWQPEVKEEDWNWRTWQGDDWWQRHGWWWW